MDTQPTAPGPDPEPVKGEIHYTKDPIPIGLLMMNEWLALGGFLVTPMQLCVGVNPLLRLDHHSWITYFGTN